MMQLCRCHLADLVGLGATLQLVTVVLLLSSSTNGRPAFDQRRPGRGDGSASAVALHPPPLHVVVSPDVTTIDSSTERVRVTCSAAAAAAAAAASSAIEPEDDGDDRDEDQVAPFGGDELPYISFFWIVIEHTSMPLSSNIPGVTVTHQPYAGTVEDYFVNGPATKRRTSHRRRHGKDVSSSSSSSRRRPTNVDVGFDFAMTQLHSPEVTTSSLIIDSRFYHVLHWGDNKFACKAITLSGRRATGFFTIRKI